MIPKLPVPKTASYQIYFSRDLKAGPRFSGEEVYKVLVNVGNFKVVDVTGDHVRLAKHPPEHHNTEPRYVTVPLHDELAIGTLQSIANQAGAKDYQAFYDWIERNS